MVLAGTSDILTLIIEGQGTTALTEDVGGCCLDTFTLAYHFSFLSPSEILSQRAVKPKTTNNQPFFFVIEY